MGYGRVAYGSLVSGKLSNGCPHVKILTVSVLSLAISSAVAAADLPKNLPTIDPQRLSAEVKILSSDAFEGRGPATPGETKTVDYVIAQMKAAGLQPGGDVLKSGKRGWTQAVPLGRFQIQGPI